jgi:hypothetical protein
VTDTVKYLVAKAILAQGDRGASVARLSGLINSSTNFLALYEERADEVTDALRVEGAAAGGRGCRARVVIPGVSTFPISTDYVVQGGAQNPRVDVSYTHGLKGIEARNVEDAYVEKLVRIVLASEIRAKAKADAAEAASKR